MYGRSVNRKQRARPRHNTPHGAQYSALGEIPQGRHQDPAHGTLYSQTAHSGGLDDETNDALGIWLVRLLFTSLAHATSPPPTLHQVSAPCLAHTAQGRQPFDADLAYDGDGQLNVGPCCVMRNALYRAHGRSRVPITSPERVGAWSVVCVGKWKLALNIRIQKRARLRRGL